MQEMLHEAKYQSRQGIWPDFFLWLISPFERRSCVVATDSQHEASCSVSTLEMHLNAYAENLFMPTCALWTSRNLQKAHAHWHTHMHRVRSCQLNPSNRPTQDNLQHALSLQRERVWKVLHNHLSRYWFLVSFVQETGHGVALFPVASDSPLHSTESAESAIFLWGAHPLVLYIWTTCLWLHTFVELYFVQSKPLKITAGENPFPFLQ